MSIDKLFPFHKKHSISEVSLNLYLANPIIRPERFKMLLEDDVLRGEFDEFNVAYQHGVKVKISKAGDPEINVPEKKITGFRFTKFRDGSVSWVIQLNNGDPDNGVFPILSFHCLDPDYDWDIFLPKTIALINKILLFEASIFVNAIGLNYIDQFNWLGEIYPSLNVIFKEDSDFLPKIFFRNSDDFSFTFNGIHKDPINQLTYVENVDIFARTISLGNVNIGLVHLIVNQLKESTNLTELIKNTFDNSLSWSHNKNKDFLKNVLTNEVINKIHLI